MRRIVAGMFLGVALASIPAQAHHSFLAEFDPNKPITVTGPVTKVEWANPHIFLYLDVKDATGTVTNWAVEMGNPLALIRLGWSRNDIKVGNVVTVEGSLARDGSKLMNAKAVLLNGKKMFAGSSQATTP
jgi:DNA/RNA endonuclease YhcR with UshA esterase domain